MLSLISPFVLAVAGISITLLVLPGDFTHYLELVKNLALGPVIIYGMKLVLAFPVTYHFLNGIRHLVSAPRQQGSGLEDFLGFLVFLVSLLLSRMKVCKSLVMVCGWVAGWLSTQHVKNVNVCAFSGRGGGLKKMRWRDFMYFFLCFLSWCVKDLGGGGVPFFFLCMYIYV